MKKQLTVAIAKTDEQEQTATGLVYAPLTVDSQNDFMTAPDIKRASQQFMKSARTNAIDVNHDGNFVDAFIAESMISKGGDFPQGSWVVTAKIENPTVWQAVRDGKLTGFSMMGTGQRKLAKLNGKSASQLHDVEIESISLVTRAANKETFSVVKNDNLGDALTAIAEAIQKQANTMDAIVKRQKQLDEKIAALPTSIPEVPGFGRPVRKAAPANPNADKIVYHERGRDRGIEKLEKYMERPDQYPHWSEAELLRTIEKHEDALVALGHAPARAELDSLEHSKFYQTGGSSQFLQATPSSFADILGVGHQSRGISKADEDAISLNCLVI